MKVYDLGCEHGHRFEGWFGSAQDFDAQQAGALLECPLCGSRTVRRLPSAARLNLSQARHGLSEAGRAGEQTGAVPAGAAPGADVRALQAAWLRLARHVMAVTEDVGERFADEARRIHYDEAPARPIRGVATPRQAAELADEGIEALRLPLPHSAKEPLQ